MLMDLFLSVLFVLFWQHSVDILVEIYKPKLKFEEKKSYISKMSGLLKIEFWNYEHHFYTIWVIIQPIPRT